MNADQALKLTVQKEIFISRSAPTARDDSEEHFLNVWLQVPEKSSLVFDTSEPSTNSSTGSLTWKLERNGAELTPRPTSLAFSMFYSTGGRQASQDRLIYVRVDFSGEHVRIQMQAPEMGRQLRDTVQTNNAVAPGAWGIRAQLKLFPGITVSTAISRNYLNDQQWYILRVSADERPVEARPLKSLWHSLKGLSCGGK